MRREPGTISASFSWLGLGVALGSLLIVTLSVTLGRTIPLPLAGQCDLVARTGSATWQGLPVGWLGIGTVLVIGLCALWTRTLILAYAFALGGTLFAVDLQIRIARPLGLVCPWCVLATGGLLVATVSLLIGQRPLPGSRSLSVALGLAVPMLLAGLSPSRVPPRESFALPSVNRSLITGRSVSDRREIVVFSSPQCPACRHEIPRLLNRFALGRELVIRFTPLVGSPEERRLGALTYLAIEARRDDTLRLLYSETPAPLRARLAEKALRPTRAQLGTAYCAVDADMAMGRALEVAAIPFVADCPPDSACRRIDAALLMESP